MKILVYLFGTIVFFGLMVIDPGLAVFVLVGLVPTFVWRLVDNKPGKNTSATITFFNLAGLTIPCSKFLEDPSSIPSFPNLDMVQLMVVYLFATMGWFIAWLIPKIVVIMVDLKNEKRAVRIKEKMNELLEEWGTDIKKSN
jgi:hypothetical protein